MGNACGVQPNDTNVTELLGKKKYIIDVGCIAMQMEEKRGHIPGVVVVFATPAPGLCVAFLERGSGLLHVREYSDSDLGSVRDKHGIQHGWAPFFKSIASDVSKGKATVTANGKSFDVRVTITSTKDPNNTQPFVFELKPKASPSQADVIKYILTPLSKMVQAKRLSDKDKDLKVSSIETDQLMKEASRKKHKDTIDRLQPKMPKLREDADRDGENSSQLLHKVQAADRRLRKLKRPADSKHQLDSLYEDGGAQPFSHIVYAEEHEPVDKPYSAELCEFLKAKLPQAASQNTSLSVFFGNILKQPSTPEIQRLSAISDTMDLSAFSRLDDWDYNVFQVDKMTNGNALFFTTYALLHKLDLINHFGFDDQVVRNFLQAVQAGYHPNPYHNSVHAADVAQINYYITIKCGLSTTCGLSKEDILASVIAGAIHDYDHPGLNNSFHYSTKAYLSTLYNDRSILENHHLACVFEMLRLPKFNFFAKLSEEQVRKIRETMTEMVLSTDMGIHGRILGSFQRRLQEGTPWAGKVEDTQLALSMSIKMADIANCGRPTELYKEWAKNIAAEFYNQGDVEQKLKLPVSPFMDRRKDKQEFPKGQTSFINFIVIPTFEAMAEFLPNLHFALGHCGENKEYWQKRTEK